MLISTLPSETLLRVCQVEYADEKGNAAPNERQRHHGHARADLRWKFAAGDLAAFPALEGAERGIEESADESRSHLSRAAVAALNRLSASRAIVRHLNTLPFTIDNRSAKSR
jgi:hypothetical protein